MNAVLAFTRYWLTARRVELLTVLASAVPAALLWPEELPTDVVNPQLPPDHMIQMFAVLQATCVVMLLRRDTTDVHLRLAGVRLVVRRAAVLGTALALCGAATLLAVTPMPDEHGAVYLRNTVAYCGVGLMLSALSTVAAVSGIWLWLVLSVTQGRTYSEGFTLAHWWAYPVYGQGEGPEVAWLLLLAGAAARLLR